MKRSFKKYISLLLAVLLLTAAVPVYTAAAGSADIFPDVPRGAWYEVYLDKIIWAQQQVGQMNIISGYPDGRFGPSDPVRRGEFLKMLFEASESSGNETAILAPDAVKPDDHWAEKYYLKAKLDNVLVADVYSSTEPMFSGSAADLNKTMSRYEMAVILNNVCTNLAMQKTVIVNDPEQHITDYNYIPSSYVNAVEQMYGKGLLNGYDDGSFGGYDTLTRAQAVTVLYRYLFIDTINGEGLQDWAEYPKATTAPRSADPADSFANWLKKGHVDAYGNIDAEARERLFGTSSKSYFSSAAEADPFMLTISVPIWTIDKAGNKKPSTAAITVHYLVADEVRGIFQMIYDDPEQFPIYGGWSAGGARYTDTLRHSWGCAIDINAYYNCECNIKSGPLKVTCGYGWWPIGHDDDFFAGSMTGPSVYSIGANPGEYGYSVVKAFKTYGWGWGGNGWSGGKSFDYMHFSVLPSGG